MLTVADQFSGILVAKPKWIYGIGGHSRLTASVRRRDKIEWPHVCDEEITAFAVGTNTHLTDSVATCVAGDSPSDLRLVRGLFGCGRSYVRVLAVVAPVTMAKIGMGVPESTAGSEYAHADRRSQGWQET
jgi:pyruvate dehydrogenase (quinone)